MALVACYVGLPSNSSAPILGVETHRKEDSDWWYDTWPLKQFSTKGVLSIDKCVSHLTKLVKKKHLM